MITPPSIVSEIMARERGWHVRSAPAASTVEIIAASVPRRVRAVAGRRLNGEGYKTTPEDGRRARWQSGSRRITVTPRQFRQMSERLSSAEFLPGDLSTADARFLGERREMLLRRLFTTPEDVPEVPRRIFVKAEQYRDLRSKWDPQRWLAVDLTSGELSLARERVRDWLARTFAVVQERGAEPRIGKEAMP